MKYIFLGSFFENDIYFEIVKNSKKNLVNANNLFQKNIVEGFKLNKVDLKLISFPQIGSYPNHYRKAFFYGSGDIYMSFLNIKLIKHFSQFKRIYRKLRVFLEQNTNTHISFVVYDIHLPYLYALYKLKVKFDFTVTIIVPDLIGFTGEKESLLLSIYQREQKKILQKILKSIDFFVLLTEQMNVKINIYERPYCVVEGIVSENMTVYKDKTDQEYIFYAGALDIRNGVKNLVDAFDTLKSNISLYLCGQGKLEEYIKNKAKNDSRIVYLGHKDLSEVWNLECNAKVLINPRPDIGDFTKYSFPSKTMEYFATGVPVMMYKLPGIPLEYYNYCYTLKNTKPILLAKELDCFLQNINGSYSEDYFMARSFILKNKNSKIQVRKIIDLIEKSV